MLDVLASQVMQLYVELDQQVESYASVSGLHCPQGCGKCCNSEKVEATVLEMLPVAFNLFQENQADLLLKRLERNPSEKVCIFYREDFCRQGVGGCTQYPLRALVCRLFGFSGKRDRTGTVQLALCCEMRLKGIVSSSTTQLVYSEDDTSEKSSSPQMVVFADAGLRITTLDPAMGTRRLPINEALYLALCKVGMFLDMQQAVQCEQKDERPEPPDKPLSPFPHRPFPRKAA